MKSKKSHKLCRGFHLAMKALKTCFISFSKITIFRLNKEKDVTYAKRVCTVSFFHETVNSHNLKKANHIAHFRAS